MAEAAVCFDTGVWVKSLVAEEPLEQSEAAARLVLRALAADHIVAPSFAWAEIGSVLRKKVRQGALAADQADELWSRFNSLPIEFTETADLRAAAWEIAGRYALPTLYDAAFLACMEVMAAQQGTTGIFWTADRELLRALGTRRPPYVRVLGRDAEP